MVAVVDIIMQEISIIVSATNLNLKETTSDVTKLIAEKKKFQLLVL